MPVYVSKETVPRTVWNTVVQWLEMAVQWLQSNKSPVYEIFVSSGLVFIFYINGRHIQRQVC